ncbi:MAG TPA: efflux RND transporter permease subunit, partial [Longimicrobiales bacterium]|nr:efflux RND transporter permease subunit [Longimicrobiales bacterium]
ELAGQFEAPIYGMLAVTDAVAGADWGSAGAPAFSLHGQPDDESAVSFLWDGEWEITYVTFRDMGLAFGAAMVGIYLLVVAQFRSYVTPLVIMAPIPLTVIGVLPGHALLGSQFTATSMIGMIALAGIIVRNSILLVDFIHQQLAAGVTLEQATIDAAAARAKPIVLTALAAMLGAIFILDDPIFNGLAISLLFGILVSTALTLIVIPVLYYAVRRRRPAAASGRPLVITQETP